MSVCILDLHSVSKKNPPKTKTTKPPKLKNNPYFLSVSHLEIYLELSLFDAQQPILNPAHFFHLRVLVHIF